MTTFDKWDSKSSYKVLKNRTGLLAIWPADRENVAGWREVGTAGPKNTCLDYIEAAFADLRPNELVERMDLAATQIVRDAR